MDNQTNKRQRSISGSQSELRAGYFFYIYGQLDEKIYIP